MARANIALAEEAADLRSQISVIRAVDMKPVAEAYAEAKAKTDALVGEHDVGRALRSLQERARQRREERGGEREVAGWGD